MTERTIYLPSADLKSQLSLLRLCYFGQVMLVGENIIYAGPFGSPNRRSILFEKAKDIFSAEYFVIEWNFHNQVWEIVP